MAQTDFDPVALDPEAFAAAQERVAAITQPPAAESIIKYDIPEPESEPKPPAPIPAPAEPAPTTGRTRKTRADKGKPKPQAQQQTNGEVTVKVTLSKMQMDELNDLGMSILFLPKMGEVMLHSRIQKNWDTLIADED